MEKEVKKIREVKSNVRVVRELNIKGGSGAAVSKNESGEFQEDFIPSSSTGPSLPSTRLSSRVPEAREDNAEPVRVREEREQGNRVDYMAIGNRTAANVGSGEQRAYKPVEGIQTDRIRSASVGRDFALHQGNDLLSEQASAGQIERKLRDEEDVAREKYHVDPGQARKGKRYAWEV